MRRRMLWAGVAVGVALMVLAVTAPAPWVGLPVGLLIAACCGARLVEPTR